MRSARAWNASVSSPPGTDEADRPTADASRLSRKIGLEVGSNEAEAARMPLRDGSKREEEACCGGEGEEGEVTPCPGSAVLSPVLCSADDAVTVLSAALRCGETSASTLSVVVARASRIHH